MIFWTFSCCFYAIQTFTTIVYNFNNSAKTLTKVENILTRWSVAQAGSKDEKIEVENLVGLFLYCKSLVYEI